MQVSSENHNCNVIITTILSLADSGLGSEPRLTGSYRAGFNDCTQEVIRYLSQNEVDPGLRSRITSHLTHSPRSPDRLLPRPTTILTFRESSLPVQLHLPVMSAISANQTAIMQTVPFQTVGQQQNKNGDTSADLCILNRCLFIGQPDTHDHQLQMLPKMASNTYRCGEIALVVPDHNQTMNQIPVIPLYANTEVATRNVSGEKRPIDISEKSSATSVHTLSLGEGLKDIMGDQDVKVDDVIGVCKNMTACMTVSVKRTVEEVHTNEREDAVICDVVRRSQRDDAVKCDVTHTHKREDADKYDVVHRSQREENKDAVHQKETKPDDAHMDDSWRPWL